MIIWLFDKNALLTKENKESSKFTQQTNINDQLRNALS